MEMYCCTEEYCDGGVECCADPKCEGRKEECCEEDHHGECQDCGIGELEKWACSKEDCHAIQEYVRPSQIVQSDIAYAPLAGMLHPDRL